MAQKLRRRVERAIQQALLARDRMEIHAIDALLAPIERRRRGRRATRNPSRGVTRRVS